MALTTDFVAAVRRQGSIPSTLAAADILAVGDEAIQSTFIPLLTSLRSNYLVRTLDVSPDERGRVALPPRAAGAALRSVSVASGNGWFPLPQRDLGDADFVSSGMPQAYALDAGSILLLPSGTSATLRLRYAARPGRMCLNTDTTLAALITAVGAPGATTTAITAALAIGGPTAVDVVSSGPAHQQKAISAITGGATPNLTLLNVDLIEQPIVVDYIAIAGRSPFVPLPEELFSALVHTVAAELLLELGYLEEYDAQEKKAEKATARAVGFLKPRNEGNPQTVKGGLRRALGASTTLRWRR